MKVEWIVEFTHFQFELSDPEHAGDTDPGGDEEEGHLVAQLAPELMDFTVLSPRYSRYSLVTVEVGESPPRVDLDEWDHAVECSLICPSGRIEIWTPTGDSVYCPVTRERVDNYFEVEPAIYQALILFANYDSTVTRVRANEDNVEYGMAEIPSDAELDRLDRYHIHFCPVSPIGTRLLKRSGEAPRGDD